jgi:hypothetical protein
MIQEGFARQKLVCKVMFLPGVKAEIIPSSVLLIKALPVPRIVLCF